MSLFIILTTAFMADAHAITPPEPEPNHINLGEGLVFHLTPPEFVGHGYPESGLYRDGELVYTFDEWSMWSRTGSMYFSNDAMSFLVVEPTIIPEFLHIPYIRFYERGVLAHTISVQSLLRYGDRELSEPDDISHVSFWLIREDTYHNRKNDKLEVITVEGYKIIFDLSTGTVLSQEISLEHVPPEEQSGRISTAMVLIGGTLLVVCVVVVFLTKKFSHTK